MLIWIATWHDLNHAFVGLPLLFGKGPNECGLVFHVYVSLCYCKTNRIRLRIHKVRNNKIKIERRVKFPQPQFNTNQSHEIRVFSQSNRWIVLKFWHSVIHSQVYILNSGDQILSILSLYNDSTSEVQFSVVVLVDCLS